MVCTDHNIEDYGIHPITSQQMSRETMKTVQALFSWAPKSLEIVTAAVKKRDLILGK